MDFSPLFNWLGLIASLIGICDAAIRLIGHFKNSTEFAIYGDFDLHSGLFDFPHCPQRI
jgi:hypothetical protein